MNTQSYIKFIHSIIQFQFPLLFKKVLSVVFQNSGIWEVNMNLYDMANEMKAVDDKIRMGHDIFTDREKQ